MANAGAKTYIWHGPDVGVPKSIPARTDFEKFVRISPLLTRAIACGTRPFCPLSVYFAVECSQLEPDLSNFILYRCLANNTVRGVVGLEY